MHFFFDNRSTEFLNIQSGFSKLFYSLSPCLTISPAKKNTLHAPSQLTLDCILRIRPAAFLFVITFGPNKEERREKKELINCLLKVLSHCRYTSFICVFYILRNIKLTSADHYETYINCKSETCLSALIHTYFLFSDQGKYKKKSFIL